ncbi:MAG: hypothetical protein RLZZ70_464 [Candidatus Parcubacteria bacterium]|jgi:hypothetical protein
MKKIIVGGVAIVVLFSFVVVPVQAATSDEIQQQVEILQQQIKKLDAKKTATPSGVTVVTNNPNLTIYSTDDGKSGTPKITLTAPTRKKTTFAKGSKNDPIGISWTALNVPVNTNLTIDLNGVKINGPVGGGSAQFALPSGDSTGTYKWDIYGEGRASAGTYRVQLGLEECSQKGCTYNAHFPGQEEDVELYAQSRSVGIKIVGTSPVPKATKRATITTIDDLHTANPTVTGTTVAGVSSVGFSIGQGDLIYGSGPIPVLNNRWSHTISEDLPRGTYTITVRVDNQKADEQKFKVK